MEAGGCERPAEAIVRNGRFASYANQPLEPAFDILCVLIPGDDRAMEGLLPNKRSAIKAHKVSERRRLRNRSVRSELRTEVRKARVLVAAGSEDAASSVALAAKELDKAASKGIIHKNQAARRKSRIMRALVAAQAPREEAPVAAKPARGRAAAAAKAGATKAAATKSGTTKAGATKAVATKTGATKDGATKAVATKAVTPRRATARTTKKDS
ncbi:MAG: ribosomal protein [Chloroflexi bacterium]|nr:ribosomal protein [Chloroflexota bacterium]